MGAFTPFPNPLRVLLAPAVGKMVIGCMIFFNEAWILERTMRALKERVDAVIAVDGPYQAFPHDAHFSTDGSLAIADAIADVVIQKPYHWLDEIEKRNAYLEASKSGDWVLAVDADEEMQGILPSLSGDAFRIRVLDRKDSIPMELFRLFKMGEATQYKGTHFAIFQNGQLRNNEPMPILEGASFLHHRSDRPPERANLKGPYMEWLKVHEREFREKWNPLT